MPSVLCVLRFAMLQEPAAASLTDRGCQPQPAVTQYGAVLTINAPADPKSAADCGAALKRAAWSQQHRGSGSRWFGEGWW